METKARKRSSSTTISIPEEFIPTTDGVTEDAFIAQALLNNSHSGHDPSTTLQQHTRPIKSLAIPHRRPHAGTSNTWTSSEGEIPSELDELNSRAAFVAEYNRIAERVRCSWYVSVSANT